MERDERADELLASKSKSCMDRPINETELDEDDRELNRNYSTGVMSTMSNNKRAIGSKHIEFNLTTNHQIPIPPEQFRKDKARVDGKKVVAIKPTDDTKKQIQSPVVVYTDSETEDGKGNKMTKLPEIGPEKGVQDPKSTSEPLQKVVEAAETDGN